MADNLPACLAKYRGRKVWPSTWGELRARYGTTGPPEPLFVKPLRRNKDFPAIALYDADDVAAASPTGRRARRCWSRSTSCSCRSGGASCCQGHILDLCHYQGELFRYPDPKVVQEAIADYGGAPAGYAIDFGVLTDGRTVLVEVNDGYSLGSYGLNSVEYSELLEARWVELTGI